MTSWKQITDYASLAGSKFPACVAAQWALESGYGEHLSGKNNFFGIKATPDTPSTVVSTKEFVDDEWITIDAAFKDFTGAYDCVKYLVKRWYKDYGGYQGVNRASSREDCARLLVSEGYATDPAYAEKLIKLMDDNVEEVSTTKGGSYLENAALYYSEEKHQVAAWRELEASLGMGVLKRFKAAYRNAEVVVEEQAEESRKSKFPLQAPYFYQRDSKTGHGERMCYSSSMAMAMDYIDPDAIEGDDDWYLNEVFKFGDSVSSTAQVEAAESLGFTVTFKTDLTQEALEAQLDLGMPIPVGILHKGGVDKPKGGGHWVCVIGYDETHYDVHDPFGELELISGGYSKAGPEDGKFQRYSKVNFSKRWEIEGPGSGWGMIFR